MISITNLKQDFLTLLYNERGFYAIMTDEQNTEQYLDLLVDQDDILGLNSIDFSFDLDFDEFDIGL